MYSNMHIYKSKSQPPPTLTILTKRKNHWDRNIFELAQTDKEEEGVLKTATY